MKKIEGTLVGIDGNGFVLIGHFRKLAKRQGWDKEDIDTVVKEAMSKDYDHLLNTLMSHMTMDSE